MRLDGEELPYSLDFGAYMLHPISVKFVPAVNHDAGEAIVAIEVKVDGHTRPVVLCLRAASVDEFCDEAQRVGAEATQMYDDR